MSKNHPTSTNKVGACSVGSPTPKYAENDVNHWRADFVRPEEMLSQAEALQNAAAVYEGYFMVPLVVDKEGSEA